MADSLSLPVRVVRDPLLLIGAREQIEAFQVIVPLAEDDAVRFHFVVPRLLILLRGRDVVDAQPAAFDHGTLEYFHHSTGDRPLIQLAQLNGQRRSQAADGIQPSRRQQASDLVQEGFHAAGLGSTAANVS